MTVKITTNTDESQKPRKTEVLSPTPVVPEIMQHADVKIAKVHKTFNFKIKKHAHSGSVH